MEPFRSQLFAKIPPNTEYPADTWFIFQSALEIQRIPFYVMNIKNNNRISSSYKCQLVIISTNLEFWLYVIVYWSIIICMNEWSFSLLILLFHFVLV